MQKVKIFEKFNFMINEKPNFLEVDFTNLAYNVLYCMKISRHENFAIILISRFYLAKIAFHGILISRLGKNYEFRGILISRLTLKYEFKI